MRVTIYTRPDCAQSQRAKAVLRQKGVYFVEHDITTDPQAREEMERQFHTTETPIIAMGRRVFRRIDDKELMSTV